MIKLVAFDWNGTLIADTQTVVDCTNKQLKVFGNKKISIIIYRQTFEIPVNKFFQNIGLDPKIIEKKYKKSGDVFHREYEIKVQNLRTRSGSKKLLEWLKNKKVKSVIFSNHATHRIKEQTDRLKISGFFDAILANYNTHDSYTIKGKEKRLIDYLKREKIKHSEILIIGDTDEEIIIGRDMGSKTVAITGGHSTTKRLRAEKPDYLINNLGEIVEIIKKLNS
jgi:phosphoglycolate phosphatase-like HAD superfamily hydrolase